MRNIILPGILLISILCSGCLLYKLGADPESRGMEAAIRKAFYDDPEVRRMKRDSSRTLRGITGWTDPNLWVSVDALWKTCEAKISQRVSPSTLAKLRAAGFETNKVSINAQGRLYGGGYLYSPTIGESSLVALEDAFKKAVEKSGFKGRIIRLRIVTKDGVIHERLVRTRIK